MTRVVIVLMVVTSGAFLAAPAWADCRAASVLASESLRVFETDRDAALGGLRQAFKDCPESFEIAYNLGLALYKAGRAAEAYRTWQELARRRGDHLPLLANLGKLALKLNRLDDAEAWAEKAGAVSSTDREVVALRLAVAGARERLSREKLLDVARLPRNRQVQDQAFALVVGVGRYENLNGPRYAARDAEQVKAHLTWLGGFKERNVRLLLNEQATIGRLRNELRWLLQQARRNLLARSVFYFSGHGCPVLTDEEPPQVKDGLLVPFEAGRSGLDEYSALGLNHLKSQMAEVNNPNLVAIIDACFSGAGKSVSERKPAYLRVDQSLLASDKLLISAASAGQTALEYPEGQQGAFTYFFLEGLADQAKAGPDGWVEAAAAFDHARRQLAALGRDQVPQMSGSGRLKLAKVR